MEEFKKMNIGDKLIVQSTEQIMVIEVLESKNGSGMLVYRPPMTGEI